MNNDLNSEIILILPPHLRLLRVAEGFFPLGLGYIASVLKNNGYGVSIYDADIDRTNTLKNYDPAIDNHRLYLSFLDLNDDTSFINSPTNQHIWDEVRSTVAKYRPRIVGISVSTVTVDSALKVAEICKELNPDTKVVMGGIQPTVAPDEIMKNPEIDFVVRGEGEMTMLELTQAILKKNPDFSEIKGISYRNNDSVLHNQDREYIQDMNEIPFPARQDIMVNYDSIAKKYKKDIFIGTSRGCPYGCSFCSCSMTWGKKVRFRSVENIMLELKMLVNEHGIEFVIFYDDNLTIDRGRLIELCYAIIAEGLNIKWACLSRADRVDSELLNIMKRAGCYAIGMGVESGSDRMLEIMNKKEKIEKMIESGRLIKKHNIWLTLYFMVGLPSETKDDIQKSRELIEIIRPNEIYLYRFYPVPKTTFYSQLIDQGVIGEGYVKGRCMSDFANPPNHKFVNEISKEEFKSIAYDFFKFVIKYNKRRRRFTHNFKFLMRVLQEKATSNF